MPQPSRVGRGLTPQVIEELRADPYYALSSFAKVRDQKSGQSVPYDPSRVTKRMQQTILKYVTDPPRTVDGQTRFLSVLKGRQGGGSLSTELAFYTQAAYTEGWIHHCICDTEDRSNTLHERVQFTHSKWQEEFRSPQLNTNETRQISFANRSTMTVHSAHVESVGVGASPRSIHASELPLWKNAEATWSYITPSIINQDNVLVVSETTPFPMSEPSSEWTRDEFSAARLGEGRRLYAFFPFWDSRLCVRAWPEGSAVTNEEHTLLNQYGRFGLRLEHLAFRRLMMEQDQAIRRNPSMFAVYYPFDDVTCWMTAGSGHIPLAHLERFTEGLIDPIPDEPYTEFEKPKHDSLYVIGVDPAGTGGRDHAAFVVLELWQHDWRVVATYSARTNPNDFSKKLFAVGMKYNRARVVVERNGVGQATIVLLVSMNYPNLYYDDDRKAGIHSGNHERRLAELIDHLIDDMGAITDKNLFEQLQSYRSDAMLATTIRGELLGHSARGRRPKHHWDKVSALMMATQGARRLGGRVRPRSATKVPDNVVPFDGTFTFDMLSKVQEQAARDNAPRDNGFRFHFRSRR